MSKVNEWMERRYSVLIVPLTEDQGIGYHAFIPQMGQWGVCGCGDRIEEALASLESCKRAIFGLMSDDGREPPLPDDNNLLLDGREVSGSYNRAVQLQSGKWQVDTVTEYHPSISHVGVFGTQEEAEAVDTWTLEDWFKHAVGGTKCTT